MKTILVTGAAGFIGAKVSLGLLNKDIEVVGVDNLNDYYDVRLKEYRLQELQKSEGFKFEKVDIESFFTLDPIFAKYKFDAVINLAARAGVRYSIENPHIYLSTNAAGSLNILELMKKYEISKYILASSSSLYAGGKMPFNEDLPVNTPISPYAASKKAAEVMAYTYHKLFDFDVTILRYFTVYGPAGRPDMSPFRFIKWIDEGTPIELYGDGTQARDFTFLDDIALGTIKALKPVKYEIINLGGGGKPITINYMISKMEEYLGKKATIKYKPFHAADMKETSADITKAGRILDWEPMVSFEEGLKRTVEWYKENREFISTIDLPTGD